MRRIGLRGHGPARPPLNTLKTHPRQPNQTPVQPMIRLTRLNHFPVVVNADLIVFVEPTPDTLLTLLGGERLHVRETVDDVIALSLTYQQRKSTGPVARPIAAETEE
jgi:flagellar protein FlbD